MLGILNPDVTHPQSEAARHANIADTIWNAIKHVPASIENGTAVIKLPTGDWTLTHPDLTEHTEPVENVLELFLRKEDFLRHAINASYEPLRGLSTNTQDGILALQDFLMKFWNCTPASEVDDHIVGALPGLLHAYSGWPEYARAKSAYVVQRRFGNALALTGAMVALIDEILVWVRHRTDLIQEDPEYILARYILDHPLATVVE